MDEGYYVCVECGSKWKQPFMLSREGKCVYCITYEMKAIRNKYRREHIPIQI